VHRGYIKVEIEVLQFGRPRRRDDNLVSPHTGDRSGMQYHKLDASHILRFNVNITDFGV
ncbi:hypothetical protein DPMN_116389, partial [Dreissena polymorpha]